jgi:hypothetical protein
VSVCVCVFMTERHTERSTLKQAHERRRERDGIRIPPEGFPRPGLVRSFLKSDPNAWFEALPRVRLPYPLRINSSAFQPSSSSFLILEPETINQHTEDPGVPPYTPIFRSSFPHQAFGNPPFYLNTTYKGTQDSGLLPSHVKSLIP